MKLRTLLAAVSATVLLGAFVSSAFARNIEVSTRIRRTLFLSLIFGGGFGNVECEVRIGSSLHASTFTKTVGSLIGYVTEGNVSRCSRGGATINQASLPWHRRYRSFAGALPNITGLSETITGAEWNIREPTFGITCTVRREASSAIGTLAVSGGTVTSESVSGTSSCGSFSGSLSGSTTNVTNGSGTRITIRLI